uniref:Uncharacterized protein n=1 Tax=Rangifer tarandus platyrhynchus TaxID=3082113 RepID=A0ACB0EF03_RANTA|nr:unnamed protein product [Rangifer tarandus platyrhynchus]
MCLPQWQQDPAIRCSELSQCRSARPSLPHPPSAAAFRQRPPRPGPRGPAPHPRVQRASACTVPETRSRLPAPAPPHSPRLVPLAALPFLQGGTFRSSTLAELAKGTQKCCLRVLHHSHSLGQYLLTAILSSRTGSRPEPPLQVGAELQSRFFASQGCARSPFQAALVPSPRPQALRPSPSRWTCSPSSPRPRSPPRPRPRPPASTVDTAALKQPPRPPRRPLRRPPPLLAPVSAATATIAAAAVATALLAPTSTLPGHCGPDHMCREKTTKEPGALRLRPVRQGVQERLHPPKARGHTHRSQSWPGPPWVL